MQCSLVWVKAKVCRSRQGTYEVSLVGGRLDEPGVWDLHRLPHAYWDLGEAMAAAYAAGRELARVGGCHTAGFLGASLTAAAAASAELSPEPA